MTDNFHGSKSQIKNPIPYRSGLSNDQLIKLKQQTISLSPTAIIQEALQMSSNIREQKSNQRKSEDILEIAKKNAVNIYIEELRSKKECKMKEHFKQKIVDYNNQTDQIRDQIKKEKEEYISKYNSEKEDNINLRQQVTQLNNHLHKLEDKLKDSENSIFKLQDRFELFNKHMPLFDQFVREYPLLNPIEIMKEISSRKRESLEMISELNQTKSDLSTLKAERKIRENTTRKIIDELNEKLFHAEQDNKGKAEKYEKEIITLQEELNTFKAFKEENIFLHNMLFRLYNMLFEAFRLDKGININPQFLDIQESDFNPNLFDNNELSRYIVLMIINMKSSSSDKLLRETIAYSNMMLRVFMKEKVNLRYDPVNTFKDIKTLLETKEEKNRKLTQDIKILETKVTQLEFENKKLINQIKHRMNTPSSAIQRSSSVFNAISIPSNNVITNAKSLNSHIELHKSDSFPDDITLQKNHTRTAKKENKVFQKTSKEFPTHNDINSNLNKSNDEKSKKIEVKYQRTITPHSHKSYYAKPEFYNSKTNEEIMKKFKDLKQSKSKDKLLKTHGFQSLVAHLNGFQNLVDHTNRLFFYQAKMKGKAYRGRSMLKVKETSIRQRPLSASYNNYFIPKDDLMDNVVKRLNGMINTLDNSEHH